MSNGYTVRDSHDSNYTCISNDLWGSDLSWKAKAFLGFLLSLPDTWNFSYAGLSSVTGLSTSSIKRLIEELKNLKYLKIIRKNPNETGTGRYEYVYIIYEVPYE